MRIWFIYCMPYLFIDCLYLSIVTGKDRRGGYDENSEDGGDDDTVGIPQV